MERIHILMASNDGYSDLLICCIRSVIQNALHPEKLNFHIIDDSISDLKKELISKIARDANCLTTFYAPPQMKGYMASDTCALDKSTYYRLYVCTLIDESINKVIYLDCDTVVLNHIEDLWSIDISDYYLAGVQDINIKGNREAVDVCAPYRYINAGVLLINLAQWRKSKIEESFTKYLGENNWVVEFNDQGVINHVCKGKIRIISPKYNFMTPYDRYTRKELIRFMDTNNFYDEETIKEAKKAPVIIHYAGTAAIRPWYAGSRAIYEKEFLQYYDYSEKHTLRQMPNDIKSRLRLLIARLPNGMSLMLTKYWDTISYKKRAKYI